MEYMTGLQKAGELRLQNMGWESVFDRKRNRVGR